MTTAPYRQCFAWWSFTAGRPETAPPEVVRAAREGIARVYPERKAALEQALRDRAELPR